MSMAAALPGCPLQPGKRVFATEQEAIIFLRRKGFERTQEPYLCPYRRDPYVLEARHWHNRTMDDRRSGSPARVTRTLVWIAALNLPRDGRRRVLLRSRDGLPHWVFVCGGCAAYHLFTAGSPTRKGRTPYSLHHPWRAALRHALAHRCR